MSAETDALDRIEAAVKDLTTVEDSLMALTSTYAAEFKANANNPARIIALADAMVADKQRIADFTLANTPVVPAP